MNIAFLWLQCAFWGHFKAIQNSWPRVFGSIWKYRMQWFSWRTCTVGTNVECRRHELLGGSGGMPPRTFVKLESLKCNFPRSLDRSWVTGRVLKGVKKCSQKKKYLSMTDLAIIIISLQLFVFLKKCTNPISLESESCSLEIVFIRSKGWVTITVGVRIITIDFKSQSSHCHCYL